MELEDDVSNDFIKIDKASARGDGVRRSGRRGGQGGGRAGATGFGTVRGRTQRDDDIESDEAIMTCKPEKSIVDSLDNSMNVVKDKLLVKRPSGMYLKLVLKSNLNKDFQQDSQDEGSLIMKKLKV
jgi:hypothetical protein